MSKYLISALLLIGIGIFYVMAGTGGATGASLNDISSTPAGGGTALLNQSVVSEDAVQTVVVMITGYSSRPQETDDTPFTTASGTKVRPGVVAANWLPLGAKIRIPELFGDSVFTVEDRMHRRHDDKVDVWFPTTEEALRFGVRKARVEIL